jgi:hypothetical protein
MLASVVFLLMTRTSRKGIALSDFVSIVNWNMAEELLQLLWAMSSGHKYVTTIPMCSDGLCRVQLRANF